MLAINWTTEARSDLHRIENWLTENRSPITALQTLIDIRQRVAVLEAFPRSGRPGKDGVRTLVIYRSPYIVLYRVTTDCVDILRIRHQRENWQLPV